MGKVTAEEMQGLMYGNANNTARGDGSSPQKVSASDMENLMAPYRSQEIKHTVLSPSTQPTQAAPAGASSRKQSETMKQNVDTLKKQRDDALIKAGAYSRAGNMQQQAKEQRDIASELGYQYENARSAYKTQKNMEDLEGYNPNDNHFKAGDMALAGIQNAFQGLGQGIVKFGAYANGPGREEAWEAKRLIDSGMNGLEAQELAGIPTQRKVPITDYKTKAEIRHERNVESTHGLERLGLQLGNTIFNMVPSLALNVVAPGSQAGLIFMSASAAGNKFAEALEKYDNPDMAFALSTGAGLAAYGSEQLGGIYGKAWDSKVGQALQKKLVTENPALYAFANSVGGKLLRDSLSEGLEEGIEDDVNYAIEKALTGESDERDNIWYDMLLGALAGGVLGGANATTRAVNYNRLGKTLKKSPAAVQQQIEEGLSKGEGTAPAIYAAEAQKKPTPQMLGRLFEANQSFDAESGLSKIQGDITQLSVRELKAMMNNANAIVQAAETLGVKPTPESVMTEVFSKQKEAAIRTAQDGVEQAFSQMVDNPANAGEVAYNSAIQGAPANQSAAQKVYNDPAARESFAKLAGIEYTGNPAADVAAIEVATKKLGETGRQVVSEAEYTERMTEAAERANAELEAKAEAEADVLEQESLERWLSIEQNTDIDIDGKRHVREITDTDVRGNSEISYKKAEIPNSKKPAVNAVEGAAKFLGKTIVWYEGAINVNGKYRLANGYRAGDGTIYLNINSADPLMVTFGHEMLHDLVTHNEYEGMIKTLTEDPTYAEMVDGIAKAKEELYQRNGIELDMDAALEEVAADISGEVLNDRKVMEYIGAKNAEVATGINKWLGKVLNKLRGKPSAQEAYNRLSESQKALLDGMEGRTESTNSAEDAGGSYSLMEDAQYMADIDRVVSEATEKANDELKAAQAEVKNIRQQLADYRQQATAEAKNTAAWKDGEAKLIADLSEAQSKEKKARALASYMDEYNAISERYRGEVRATDTEALAQYNEKLSNLRSGFRGEMEKLAIEQGAFKRGEKAARDIYVPTSVNGQKVTRGTRTILEASQTPESMLEEHAKEILAGARGYEVIGDKKAQEYAERIIDKDGYGKADELFTNAVNGDQVLDKKTLVLGEYLYMEAAKAGDVKNAMRYAADVAAAATRAGQVVQAMRVLKKATPTGKLYYLNRMVDTMNKNIVDNGGDPIQIDEGLARKLLEAENIKDPKEQGKAVDETIDEIEQNIADQIPATAWDKWNAWRYLSMLGNIRTQVRNVVGNAAFMPLVATKNLIAAGMEKAFIRNGGRTKSSFFTKTNVGKRLMEFGEKDFDTVVDEIQGGGKYNQSSSIEEKRTIFKSKAIEGWRKLTNKAMDKGDEIFSKHHYARALAGYLYANHLDYDKITRNTPQAQEVLNKARAYAILEAQKATFRDANQLASFINKIKRNLLKKAQTAETKGAKAGWYVGTAIAEGIMPFTKTPINILARGVEYSPIGLIKGIKEAVYDVKKGNKTAAEAIDTLSAGLTGTGIFALGYFLQSLGLLAGALDDDKESKYKKDRGAQGFAIHIGDKYYTIDWLAPFSLPLFTGAAVAETVENGDEVSFATLADVFSTISEPMLEMSMLQGVNSALSNGQYSSDSKIVSFMTNQITGYLSQANPTILGQIARAVDDISRNAYYYDPNYKGFVQTGKVFGDKQIAKIPFASKALTSRIDLWGNKQENTGGSFFGRLAYNMLSPGYYSKESNDPVDVALTKLYEETEDTAVLPSKPRKTVTNNKTDYKMNAKQYEEYCIVKGQTAHKEIQTFINSAEYKKMSNEDRVDVLEHLYKYSTYKAQKNLLGNKYVASSTYSRCVKAEAYAKGGNPVYKYFLKG